MSQQRQLSLFDEVPTAADLLGRREDQWFDRKSFRTDARALADVMIGFANADGGRVAVGIREGRIEGVNSSIEHLNELLQAAIDFSQPPVRHSTVFLDCTDHGSTPLNRANHVS
jgi:ATP-dependent DNA helicase RecG